MNKLIIIFVSFLLFLPVQEEDLVQFSHYLMGEKPGEIGLLLHFRIAEGFHVQSARPLDDNLVPTVLNFELPEGLEVKEIVYQEHEFITLQGQEDPLAVYGPNLVIRVVLNADREEHYWGVVTGELTYQACDAVKCYYPRSYSFELELETHGGF